MTPEWSLRLRFVLAAILWTVGLLAVTNVVATALAHRIPLMPRVAHGTAISIGAVIVMIAGLWQVQRGLAPLQRLRTRLSAVREGHDRRVDGSYPAEVQPLVNDLNALLEHRERAITRALAKAGDLAHGLKTPLAVLAQEADRAEKDGHRDLAATIAQQVERMRRQVDYHLAQARAAASGATPGARCSVKDSADGLSRTLLRLHADRGVIIDVRVPADHFVRGQLEDLDEMLGNLLDNACQWARARVTIGSARQDGRIVITVDDDGPGLDLSLRERVLQRGVRVDEAAPGSGLGLAIVRDLAELYSGSIALSASPAGGLRATLELPAAG